MIKNTEEIKDISELQIFGKNLSKDFFDFNYNDLKYPFKIRQILPSTWSVCYIDKRLMVYHSFYLYWQKEL